MCAKTDGGRLNPSLWLGQGPRLDRRISKG